MIYLFVLGLYINFVYNLFISINVIVQFCQFTFGDIGIDSGDVIVVKGSVYNVVFGGRGGDLVKVFIKVYWIY